MGERDRDVFKYDIHRPLGLEGFEKTLKVLILGLLQSLQLLVSIGPNEVLDGYNLARRRLSSGHGNEAIELELVDFLQTVPRRFVLQLHVRIRSNPGINGLGKEKILGTSSCLNYSSFWGARSPSL